MMRHTHKFTIADDEAVGVLLEKMTRPHMRRGAQARLLRALDDAARHYSDSSKKVRQAFFHGLLTGYAVALKLK